MYFTFLPVKISFGKFKRRKYLKFENFSLMYETFKVLVTQVTVSQIFKNKGFARNIAFECGRKSSGIMNKKFWEIMICTILFIKKLIYLEQPYSNCGQTAFGRAARDADY